MATKRSIAAIICVFFIKLKEMNYNLFKNVLI